MDLLEPAEVFFPPGRIELGEVRLILAGQGLIFCNTRNHVSNLEDPAGLSKQIQTKFFKDLSS